MNKYGIQIESDVVESDVVISKGTLCTYLHFVLPITTVYMYLCHHSPTTVCVYKKLMQGHVAIRQKDNKPRKTPTAA